MKIAEDLMLDLHEEHEENLELLLCGLIYSQLAIANELKRMNDGRDKLTIVNQ
jgi:hypothetical protein